MHGILILVTICSNCHLGEDWVLAISFQTVSPFPYSNMLLKALIAQFAIRVSTLNSLYPWKVCIYENKTKYSSVSHVAIIISCIHCSRPAINVSRRLEQSGALHSFWLLGLSSGARYVRCTWNDSGTQNVHATVMGKLVESNRSIQLDRLAIRVPLTYSLPYIWYTLWNSTCNFPQLSEILSVLPTNTLLRRTHITTFYRTKSLYVTSKMSIDFPKVLTHLTKRLKP